MNLLNGFFRGVPCLLLALLWVAPVPAQSPQPAADAPADAVATTPDAPNEPDPNALAWDADLKEYAAQPGEMIAPFTFNVTNVSSTEVAVLHVGTSCGCTTAQLPPMPWRIAPGDGGEIRVNMNLAGRSGVNIKSVTVNSTAGSKVLSVKAIIPPPAVTDVQETTTNPPATKPALAVSPPPPNPPRPAEPIYFEGVQVTPAARDVLSSRKAAQPNPPDNAAPKSDAP